MTSVALTTREKLAGPVSFTCAGVPVGSPVTVSDSAPVRGPFELSHEASARHDARTSAGRRSPGGADDARRARPDIIGALCERRTQGVETRIGLDLPIEIALAALQRQ